MRHRGLGSLVALTVLCAVFLAGVGLGALLTQRHSRARDNAATLQRMTEGVLTIQRLGEFPVECDQRYRLYRSREECA